MTGVLIPACLVAIVFIGVIWAVTKQSLDEIEWRSNMTDASSAAESQRPDKPSE